jgi:hypothetical protein
MSTAASQAGFAPATGGFRSTLSRFAADESGQVRGTNIVRLMVGVAVAVLVGVGVAVPIINDVVSAGNLSSIEQTIAGFISTIIILVIFMAAASPIMGR